MGSTVCPGSASPAPSRCTPAQPLALSPCGHEDVAWGAKPWVKWGQMRGVFFFNFVMNYELKTAFAFLKTQCWRRNSKYVVNRNSGLFCFCFSLKSNFFTSLSVCAQFLLLQLQRFALLMFPSPSQTTCLGSFSFGHSCNLPKHGCTQLEPCSAPTKYPVLLEQHHACPWVGNIALSKSALRDFE